MPYFGRFFLDKEKDIIVDLYREGETLSYVLRTPHHSSGKLITNLARLCGLPLDRDDEGKTIIRGSVPCYVDGDNRKLYIFRMGNTKIANIFPDGTVEMKANIPAISKALMSQTTDYRLSVAKTTTALPGALPDADPGGLCRGYRDRRHGDRPRRRSGGRDRHRRTRRRAHRHRRARRGAR